jgi:Immunoglobulin I-set domain
MFARLQVMTSRFSARLAAVVATVLAAGTLAVLPASPALASQSIGFSQSPPASAQIGNGFYFSWNGTANNTFGARITGCFVNFSDGNNYQYWFSSSGSSANCGYTRYEYYLTNVSIQVGFNLSNGGSLTASANVQITPVPPYVTGNPNNATVTSGTAATFYAYSGGNPAPWQQWQVSTNGGSSFSDIPGANGSAYVTPSTTVADNGNLYRAVFTNGGGTTWSNLASLTVNPRVASITTNPLDATTPTGTPATFTAHADADPVASVQWYVSRDSGSTFAPATEPSATSDTLTVTPSYADNGNLYKARFTNGGGSTDSNVAQLTVQAATPVVTEDPQAAHVVAGTPVTLSADASGDPVPSVQWQVSTDAGQSYSPIADAAATQRDYTFTPAFADDGNSYRAVFSSPGGSVTSAAAAVTIDPAAPTVASQTPAVTRTAGDPATFSVSPTGDPLPTSQWSVSTDGGATFTDIDGATGYDLTFTPTYAENGNVYQNTLTNVGGTVVSDPIPLTVAASTPLVAQQPVDHTVVAGSATSFTSTATGDPTATVQWQVSTDGGGLFADLADETGHTLSLMPAFTDDGNEYRAVFTNVAGSAYSDPAQLTVSPRGPAVTTNPATTPTVVAGTPVTLSAAAQGDPTPTVEWFVSHNGGSSFATTGVTTDDYTFTPAYGDSGTVYRAVYSNVGGTDTTTDAVLTVSGSLPLVDTQPTGAAIDSGQTAAFSAHATSDPAGTVQWQQSSDGVSFADIAGETGDTLTTSVKHYADDNTWYRAKFSNVAGTTYGNAVLLTVNAERPTVTQNPVDHAALSGGSVTFSAAAAGDPSPTVQWQRSTDLGGTFTDIPGAAATDYTFTPSQADDQGLYRAVFTSPGGSRTTTAATLTVATSIVVSSQPAATSVVEGATATFSAAATGSPAPGVQWQVSNDNGTTYTDVPQSPTGSLSFAVSLGEDQDLYRAVFTNSTGSVTSDGARLTVTPKPVTTLQTTTSPTITTPTVSGKHRKPAKHPHVVWGPPTLQVEAGTVMTGTVTHLTGRTRPGALVTVYGYTQPSTTYRNLATVRAGANGLYSYTVGFKANSRIYVRVPGLANSRTVAEHVRATVSLTAAKVGSYRYVFTGTVSPRRSNQLVTLYYRIQNGQLVLATTRTDGNGRFRIDRSLLAYGQHYYSVFAAVGTDGVTLGNQSAYRPLAVYRPL